jgi:hypothetical protein
MKTKLLLIPCLACLLSGCAAIKTSKADLNAPPKGVRVYPPAIYLFVDSVRGSQYIVAPDYSRAYDVRPCTVLSSQQFGVELNDGILSKYSGGQDTTAILSFLQHGMETGAKAAGVAVSQVNLPGTFGFSDGVYRLNPDSGKFERIPAPE